MPGKIPSAFIASVLARTDIVEVIDRRVPLARKGKEFAACCPFHDEKTPSFTVSAAKQFYHCFGCGAHGSAIGFLMEYSNLAFLEALEELANAAGLRMPQKNMPAAAPSPPGESVEELLEVVDAAKRWFQSQLRAPAGKAAIAYLKSRGLDGRIAAGFGLGFAPPGWDNLLRALGSSDLRRRQLQRAGLIAVSDKSSAGAHHSGGGGGNAGENVAGIRDAAAPGVYESGGGGNAAASDKSKRLYDRFRARVIFPIEDHRGRVVAFGGRILGDGEPKYLNSPETPLFHKGASLYGLHRARRAMQAAGRVIVVEGYLDVIALAQFGFDNAVATLGTATTRAHLQRLFPLAPEIIFCFDGDRAGREAAWKAMQTALPELRGDRQVGFLFLPEGEDPDSMVRAHAAAGDGDGDGDGDGGFDARIKAAQSLPDFLFERLTAQVDMSRLDGKARLVERAKPLLAQLPKGALHDLVRDRLSMLCGGMRPEQLDQMLAGGGISARAAKAGRASPRVLPAASGQISPLALMISLLLQNPQLAARVSPQSLRDLTAPGADTLREIIDNISTAGDAGDGAGGDTTTAMLLEHFRDDEKTYAYLSQLATRDNHIAEDALQAQFDDTVAHLLRRQGSRQRDQMIEQFRHGLPPQAKEQAMRRKMKEMLDARGATTAGTAAAETPGVYAAREAE